MNNDFVNNKLGEITTRRHIQPYQIDLCPNGKVSIMNTSGETMFLTKDEVKERLRLIDLDPHRRVMYETALSRFPETDSE